MTLVRSGSFDPDNFTAGDFDIFEWIDNGDGQPDPGAITEAGLGRLITQYREAEKLKSILGNYLDQADEALRLAWALPTFFDIETAIGDQLTLLGKRLGFPRCHCVCTTTPVFGFEYMGGSPPVYEIAGFCEVSTWLGCGETGTGTVCIHQDDVYRAMLMCRRYQVLGLYDDQSLRLCLKTLWGADATYFQRTPGTVVLAPRQTTASLGGDTVIKIGIRALPIAPGIEIYLSGDEGAAIFGFGSGFAGLCEGAVWACEQPAQPYSC